MNSSFTISNESKEYFKKQITERVYLSLREWERKYNNLKEDQKEKLDKLFNLDCTYDLGNLDFEYEGLSLRDISGNILNSISNEFPLLMGGSADLSSSCKTHLKNTKNFDTNMIITQQLN